MKTLGVVCSLLVAVSATFAACGSDDARKVHAGEGGGGAGGGAEGPSASGSSFTPNAGNGGADGGTGPSAGGTPTTDGGTPTTDGGFPTTDGGASPGDGGRASSGGAGEGGAPLDCGAPGSIPYSCAIVSEFWSPVYNGQNTYFELDVSDLQYPIVSGTIDWASSWADGVDCGSAEITVVGDKVRATPNVSSPPTAVRVRDFHLVDACGNEHNFDPVGVPSCSELTGSGSFGTWTLSCTSRLDATCPDTCD